MSPSWGRTHENGESSQTPCDYSRSTVDRLPTPLPAPWNLCHSQPSFERFRFQIPDDLPPLGGCVSAKSQSQRVERERIFLRGRLLGTESTGTVVCEIAASDVES